MNYYPDILMHSDVWQGFGDDATAPKDQNHTPFNFYNGELEASTWDPIPFCFDECSRMTLGDLSHFYLDAAVEGRVLIAQQQVQSSQEPKQTEAHLTTTNATETQRFSSEFPSTTPPDSAVSQVQRDLERSHRKVPYVRKHRRRHPDCEPSKKSFHNDIEKQYRSNLNQKIAVLRDTVPSLRIVSKSKRGEATAEDYERLDGLQPAYKVNKPMVLDKTIEYIRHLEKQCNALKDWGRRLQAENTAAATLSSPQMNHVAIDLFDLVLPL